MKKRKTNKGDRGRRIEDRKGSGFDKLPYHIISTILSQLPIASVLQCRSVCKYWLTIIRDPQFATAHLARSTISNPSIILCSKFHTSTPNKMYLMECGGVKSCNQITCFNTSFGSLRIPDLEMVGSCNGLICLYQPVNSVPVYVCNPFTGEHLALPRSTPPLSMTGIMFGFGFDSNNKEYKVVRFRSLEGDGRLEVEVYTLGTGCWRSKGSIQYKLSWEATDVFVNGALHWVSEEEYGTMYHEHIVSFDVRDEEFRVIPNPDFGPINGGGGRRHLTKVGVTKGCLSLYDYSLVGYVEIWMMKEYGVKESWSKAFVIGGPMPVHSSNDYYQTLAVHRNGEALLRHSSGNLVAYNVEMKRYKDLKIQGVPKFKVAFSYVGSLITLESACGGEKMSSRDRRNMKRRTARYVSTRSRSRSCNM